MANSYTETTSRASEIPSELIEHSIGEESEGNAENLNINSGEDLSDPDSQCGINQGTSSQNSLDVLSKLACENISETSELSTDPVEAGVHESELGNETEDDDQVYDVAAAGSSGEESGSKTNETIVTEIFEDYVCDETEQCTETNQDPSHSELVRKSGRNRRPRQLSPDGSQRSHAPKRPRTSALPKTLRAKKKNDEPFKCDLCGSAYVTDPTRRGNRPKTTAHAPSPRHKLDPESGRLLTLCNACGLSFNRPKAPRHRAVCDPEAKRLYLEEARQFAASLAEGLEEQDALRLFCPRFKTSACACLQKYILADGNMDESRQRAQQLLNLLKQSKILSKQKCYSVDEEHVQTSVEGKGKRGKNIGLGNGQRKSKEFEEFVLEQRKYLRDELKLCEHGTQRVLNYSNNFLHKKLKTDPTKPFRVERQKGMAVLGKLKPIQELSSEVCCVDKCVSMTLTHSKLLQQWRDRAASGQAEARRVLAEMLTPSGGARSNCYKFISWVTGCSHSTISRVNEQMKKTGGDREPPAHGLISWWKEHPKPKKVKPKPVSHNATVSTHGVQIHHLTNAQLQALQPLGILQAAASSVGIPAALLSSNPLPANPQVITINSSHLTLSGMPATTQATQATGRQVILTPTQHTQLQIQQLQQQQQQLQMQTMQLQQQLQQQLHQEQQHIHTQNTEQNQSIQIQIPNQVISNPDAACLTLTQSHEFPSGTYTTTLHPVSQVQTVCPNNGGLGASSQSTSLSTDTFLSSDSLQILNAEQVQAAVAPHVVTFQCSNESSTTQAVPVSLIQTPVSLAL